MTDEPFWDELGIAWQAATPSSSVPLDPMTARFRRESARIRLAMALAAVGGTVLALLGAFTLWQGWRLAAWNFGARGFAVLIVAAMAWTAVIILWPVRRGDDARSFSDFAELGLARARRSRRIVVLALAACAIVALLGSLGAALRYASGDPPELSPVISIALLALLAGIVEALRRRFRGEEARFAYLKNALREDWGSPAPTSAPALGRPPSRRSS
jgi:hypothetical protein